MNNCINLVVTVAPAIVWALLAGAQARTAIQQGAVLSGLLAVESALVAWSLVGRRDPTGPRSPRWQEIMAWLSLLLPLGMQGGDHSGLVAPFMAGMGLLVVLWALWSLGRSFGIAPADRGLVVHGPYCYLRHPMYSGALITALAFVVANPAPLNVLLLGASFVSAVLRIRWEESILHGYQRYAQTVRWRLLPGVW